MYDVLRAVSIVMGGTIRVFQVRSVGQPKNETEDKGMRGS
jgi:hypothetical protein